MLRILEHSRLSAKELADLTVRFEASDERAVEEVVAGIVAEVERRGAEAVLEYTERFDGVRLSDLCATPADLDSAGGRLTPEARAAFDAAAANIRAFHQLQMQNMQPRESVIAGSRLGFRYSPIEGAAVYAPGGTALYPSSVLMGLIPASVAGVRDPILVTPPNKDGQIHPAVLYCAKLAGCRTVLKAGGAQGIAAAAFGLVAAPAQLIVGPGNRFVTGAKQLLSKRGLLKIDMPAGPSEVLIIADGSASAKFVAADLLSQAEHGADSQAVLLTDSRELAEQTAAEVLRGIEARPARAEMKSRAIRERSFAIVYDRLEQAFDFANLYAAEHLEICTRDPEKDFARIKNAGSVFLGHYAPVALGDYFSGTNHVLPTGGAARFYSGLGVDAYLKRITYQFPTKESLAAALGPILTMSEIEGLLDEHGNSASVRFEDR